MGRFLFTHDEADADLASGVPITRNHLPFVRLEIPFAGKIQFYKPDNTYHVGYEINEAFESDLAR